MSDSIASFSAELSREIQTTRRMLERAPEGRFDWRPHPRSMSLGELAAHLAEVLWWQTTTLDSDEFDIGVPRPPRSNPESSEALLKEYDAKAEELMQALARTSEADLSRAWTLRHGEHVIFASPKRDVLRTFGISHMVHHRGQFSVYLRLLDVPVPPSYGPTADEQ